MRVQLLQIDGKLPNIALMRLAMYHRKLGDDIVFQHADSLAKVAASNFSPTDRIYASGIFRRSLSVIEALLRERPDAIVGGTAVDPPRRGEIIMMSPAIQSSITNLERLGIDELEQDYSIYPKFDSSIGFTQRGCRLSCSFCVVPAKEGKNRAVGTITEIWRGVPYPRHIHLLDNDFFGQPQWRERITELREGKFKVCFNQGINARCLTDAAAEAIASVNYRDDGMKDKRIYTAWDSREDEERLFIGLSRLVKYGVKPDHIMVYMLVGYWPGETEADREYRRARLRDFGARPYPMPYVRTKELIGFQRWIVRRCDLKCSWEDFKTADYRPEKVGYQI